MKGRTCRIIKTVLVICSLWSLFYAGQAYAQRREDNVDAKQEFLKAVTDGDVVKVRALLKKNSSLATATDQNGVSALLQAVYRGHNEIADLLLASGIELNIFEAS